MVDDDRARGWAQRLTHDSDSAARILDCAVRVIEEHGESAVRVATIARMANIAVPSVYHWFGNREGLVIAAHRERFTRNLQVGLAPYQRALGTTTDRTEFRALMMDAVDQIYGPERRVIRGTRLNVVGSAATRPQLLQVVLEQQRLVVAEAGAIVARAQAEGLVRTDHDPVAVAAWMSCEAFAQIVIEVGSSSLPTSRWATVSRQAIAHVLFGEPVIHQGPFAVPELPDDMRIEPTGTAKRILDWAVERIDADGEAALRIAELTEQYGISLTSIYHHFGSRDGMVQAAQVERFVASPGAHMDEVEQLVLACSTVEEYRAALGVIARQLLDSERIPNRRRRLSVLGSLHGRPGLAEAIARVQDALIVRGAHLVEYGRTKGWLASEADSLALSAWLTGLGLSRSLIELGDVGVDSSEWDRVALDSVDAAFGLCTGTHG